jgi:arginine/ornithine transport system ATP-binding protein
MRTMPMNELPDTPATPGAPLLQAAGIRKRFGSHEVLQGLDLRARQGDVVALIGASGSGKSTFLRCLNLLEQPDAGTLALAGETLRLVPARDGTLRAADPAQLLRWRSRVAMVFQHFNLWAHMTALANVIEAPMQVLGLTRAEALERAEHHLQRVGVWHRREAYPAHLSGGEQQRVAIARALINNPGIIYADEPTGNLDASTGSGVIDMLMQVVDEAKKTLIVVTHDQTLAKRGDRRLILKEGCLEEG